MKFPVKTKQTEKHIPDIYRLLRYVPKEKQKEFYNYVENLIKDQTDTDMDFLGFMEDYENFASLLKRKAEAAELSFSHNFLKSNLDTDKPYLTVYDVGCDMALQHVFFDSRIHYVGIDTHIGRENIKIEFFKDNCSFIKGRFIDVIKNLKIDRYNAIGIANMSLLYSYVNQKEIELFDQTFRRKFVL